MTINTQWTMIPESLVIPGSTLGWGEVAWGTQPWGGVTGSTTIEGLDTDWTEVEVT